MENRDCQVFNEKEIFEKKKGENKMKNKASMLLDKKLEDTLSRIIDLTFYGVVSEVVITDNEYSAIEIEELLKHGYIAAKDTSTLSNSSWVISLTYNGKNYFEHKKKYIRESRRTNTIEWIRYIVTTAISIAALVVAIIALSK